MVTQQFQRFEISVGDVTFGYNFFLLIANYFVNVCETKQFTWKLYKVCNKTEGKQCDKLIECNFQVSIKN